MSGTTRKSVHRTRMSPPKCHSEKGYICNCDRYSMKLIIHKPNKQELSSMFITHRLNVMHASVNFYKYISYSLVVMAHNMVYYMELSQGQIIKKPNKQELSFFSRHIVSISCMHL